MKNHKSFSTTDVIWSYSERDKALNLPLGTTKQEVYEKKRWQIRIGSIAGVVRDNVPQNHRKFLEQTFGYFPNGKKRMN